MTQPAGAIPVLSLWQPHASAVEHGVKPVETRPWSTTYRGWLAIASTARSPTTDHDVDVEAWARSGFSWHHPRRGRYSRPGYWTHGNEPCLDGSILCVAYLVDVVPTSGGSVGVSGDGLLTWHDQPGPAWLPFGWRGAVPLRPPMMAARDRHYTISESQRPFGNFEPGRFAWLMACIRRLAEPVGFRGGQKLTRRWVPIEQVNVGGDW